jgi:PAS domain S-box-containing protein
VAERTAELTAAVAHTRLIIDSSAEGILQLDENGIIGLANPAACQMLGYSSAELLGRDVHAAIHCPPGEAVAHTPCSLGVAMRAGQTLRKDAETFWRADGRPLPVTVATHPMLKDSTVIGAVMSFSDNTQRQAAEEAREAARAEAERLARTKSEFLANMSHEIRTPINAVLGFAYLCLKLELPPRERDYLNKIHSASESLLGIVNDILDVSKMESGKLEMESVPFSLDEVLHRVSSLFALKARAKGVELVVAAEPGVPESLLGDPLRLGQVLINLMSNALKFTERGEIRLIVERVTLTDDDVSLRFTVRDTGLGMTPLQQAGLFTAFTQQTVPPRGNMAAPASAWSSASNWWNACTARSRWRARLALVPASDSRLALTSPPARMQPCPRTRSLPASGCWWWMTMMPCALCISGSPSRLAATSRARIPARRSWPGSRPGNTLTSSFWTGSCPAKMAWLSPGGCARQGTPCPSS